VHVDHFKPESDDPLYDSPKGSLIRQFGAKGRRARAYDDLALVKFCAQCRTGLTCESDLVRLWSHQDYASQSADQARHAAPRWVVYETTANTSAAMIIRDQNG
jgi:hypothetical protein